MGNAAWVCFDCRQSVRRNTQFKEVVPCPTCGKHCSYLGYKIPVPSKARKSEWMALRAQLALENSSRELAEHQETIKRKHQLEKEILRLQAMPENAGRTTAIKLLKKDLDRLLF